MLLKTKYDEILNELFQRRSGRKEFNCTEMRAALETYGNPHEKYPVIHVAGTNGKGQVSVKVARALEASGLKVGLYISPHIHDYRERITINGKKIPVEKVVQYYEELEGEPHFFNSSTIFAFRYFAEQKVDVAVFETGIGGRYDATNVVTPILSIITSVSYDHVEFLGQSLDSIAAEKAGIIKSGVPVVVGPNAKYLSILNEADKKASPLHIVEKKSCFYDTENQLVAKEALELLSNRFSLSAAHIEKGIKCSLPCRFEKRKGVIYDVAHNPDGFARLCAALAHYYPYRTFRFLIGMSKRKDIETCLKQVAQKAHFVHFVRAATPDAASAEELGEIFSKISDCPYAVEESITQGYANAKSGASKKDLVVVCGSFYIMSVGPIQSKIL